MQQKWEDRVMEKLMTCTSKTHVYGIFLIKATKNETWKKRHCLVSLRNLMFRSQILKQNGMPYKGSLEKNWTKQNLLKVGRVLTIFMWVNGCFGTRFSSCNLWWRQKKTYMHFRLAMIIFKRMQPFHQMKKSLTLAQIIYHQSYQNPLKFRK